MADAALSFVVQKVGNRIVKEAINLHGVKEQVEWLERQQRRMQCFLMDADAKKSNGGIAGEREKNLVTEITDLSFEVQKVIGLSKKLNPRDFFGLVVWRFKFHTCVQGIRAKIQELSQSKTLYGIANIGETSIRSEDKPSIFPELNDADIDEFGFDKEKEIIVQELVDTSNTNRSVISIVDMDGNRKIALIGAIYNDLVVKTSFKLVAWITVSQEYTIIEILKNILSQVSRTSSIDAIEILEANLIKELKEYKYLIILDDVWEENVWDQLQKYFPDVNNGSRVIIATRFSASLTMTDSAPERRVAKLQTSHISGPTNDRQSSTSGALNQSHAAISQVLPVIPRTSLSIPITEEILKSSNELEKKSLIISVISGKTSEEHLQAELPVVLKLPHWDGKVSPFGLNTFIISFHSEKEARTAESMGQIQLGGQHGPCTVSLGPWSPAFGSMEAATGSYRRITIVNLPLHCRDWATLVEVVKPAGDLVAVYKDDKITLEFVYVMVGLRRVIHLPLELELTVGAMKYLVHLEDFQHSNLITVGVGLWR